MVVILCVDVLWSGVSIKTEIRYVIFVKTFIEIVTFKQRYISIRGWGFMIQKLKSHQTFIVGIVTHDCVLVI